jgi:Ca-activated chloride channel family protein
LDYNEALLTEIASQGGGRFYHLDDPRQIPAYVAGELKEVVTMAARDMQIHLSLPPGATLVPLSATYPVQQEGGQATVFVGELPTDTEQEIPLRLALIGQAPGSRLSVEGRVTFRSPAGNELEAPLNRVTVRFLEGDKFSLREGVVAPVVERILEQMRAANVLGMARLMARQPDQAEQKGKGYLRSIHEYASLLGEQRAESEVQQISERFFQLNSDQSSSKQTVSAAFNVQRHGKTH